MSDLPNNPPAGSEPPRRPLSEISHLFLSSLRDNANPDRPKRIPPSQRKPDAGSQHDSDAPMRMPNPASTPNEHDSIEEAREMSSHLEPEPTRRRVTTVIAAHLNGHALERVTQYAFHLASLGQRIGLILADTGELRLQVIDMAGENASPQQPSLLDPRRMSEALLELNHDVDRWLLVVTDPRRVEPRSLLRMVDDWVLLITCDHDGIVSGYRMLKGLADGPKHPLSIALLDSTGAAAADRVFGKLAGVCRQFLDWDVQSEGAVEHVESASINEVLWCRARGDKAALATGPHWQVLREFLDLTPDASANAAHFGVHPDAVGHDPSQQFHAHHPDRTNHPEPADLDPWAEPVNDPPQSSSRSTSHRHHAQPTPSAEARPMQVHPDLTHAIHASPTSNHAIDSADGPSSVIPEVVELPQGVSVLSAILRTGASLLPTPVSIPMCPGAVLAVGRDRALVLVAQLGSGLSGLTSIAAGIKWLEESRQLLSMAMPQLAVDAQIAPRVHLLIDHADRLADSVRPLLGNSRITIQTYRQVRFSGRMGLLLDAA
jgi:hypothetical protein